MIFFQLKQQLVLLSDLLLKLNDEQFTQKIAHLGNSSIGGHTRHVIEMVLCAAEGYHSGEVDYINRKRNLLLETDRMFAYSVLQQLDDRIKVPDRLLKLVVDEIEGAMQLTNVTTTYFREVVYNTEHTIHHLALIKVAIIEMKLDAVGADFGLAYSTIKYNTSLVRS